MFRLDELGDCFLVTFTPDATTSHLLIDCRSFRNGDPSIQRLRRITETIKTAVGGKSIERGDELPFQPGIQDHGLRISRTEEPTPAVPAPFGVVAND
jgi:hypothetical protein